MKGRKTGGRTKGTPNQMTADAKEAIRLAAEGAGGVAALTRWAKQNPDRFWPLYARLIPAVAVSVPAVPPSRVEISLVHPEPVSDENKRESLGESQRESLAGKSSGSVAA